MEIENRGHYIIKEIILPICLKLPWKANFKN